MPNVERRPNARARRLIGILKRLRKERGLTCLDVGERIGIGPSMISRIESGKRGVRRDDLIGMLTVYGVSRTLRQALLDLYESAELPGLLDRGELHVHEDLETWIGFEQDATLIRSYQSLLIPGLLQTFPYARAVIERFGVPLTQQEIEDRVAARIARQALIRGEPAPQLRVILHQAALHQKVGGADVMRGQLLHLAEAAQRPSISIRIVPADVGAHPGMDGSFVITDYHELPSLVHLENKVASLYLEEDTDIEAYRLAYNGLSAVALPADRSADLIRRIALGMT